MRYCSVAEISPLSHQCNVFKECRMYSLMITRHKSIASLIMDYYIQEEDS